MRALHVWPQFGPRLTNGSDYYAYQLSKKLVEQGVTVDVFATRTAGFRPLARFALHWLNNQQPALEQVAGMSIHRFPVTYVPPQAVAYLFSSWVNQRWQSEEHSVGPRLTTSTQPETGYHQRALARPRIYDWLFLLGLGPWSWPLWRRLERDLNRYDVVMVGFVPFALVWQVLTLARRHRKPVVLLPLFHPDDLFHHHRIFYECFSQAQAILAQTTYSVEHFKQLAPMSNPVLIGAGVEAEAFSAPGISGDRFRVKYGLEHKRLLLTVGRKEPGKRYDLAVAAVNALADEQIKLVLIGEDIDHRPIDSPYVVYLGKIPQSDLIDAYEASDVLLFPSEHESFGIVVLEAWMRRKPVLCNVHCRPVATLVTHGQDGFACDGLDDFVFYLRQLLDNPDLARTLGERGYRKTVENYTWAMIGQKVAALYRQFAQTN